MKVIIKELKLSLTSIVLIGCLFSLFYLLFTHPIVWVYFTSILLIFVINRFVDILILPLFNKKSNEKNREQIPGDWRRSYPHENLNEPTSPPPLILKNSSYQSPPEEP